MSPRVFAACMSAMSIMLISAAHAAEAETSSDPAEKQFPRLSVAWDCGSCEQNLKVPPLLTENYEKAVIEDGMHLSDSEVAEVSIVDFRQRNPANRILFGVMAGKDRLGVRISYRGQTLIASDYSANIIEGMNALCESVAKRSYHQILAVKKRGHSPSDAAPAVEDQQAKSNN